MKKLLDRLGRAIDWLGTNKAAILAAVSAIGVIASGNYLPGLADLFQALVALFGAASVLALSRQITVNTQALGLISQHAHVAALRNKEAAETLEEVRANTRPAQPPVTHATGFRRSIDP